MQGSIYLLSIRGTWLHQNKVFAHYTGAS